MAKLFLIWLLAFSISKESIQNDCVWINPCTTGFLQEFSFSQGNNEDVGVDAPTNSVNVGFKFWTAVNLYDNFWQASGYEKGYYYTISYTVQENNIIDWAEICRE